MNRTVLAPSIAPTIGYRDADTALEWLTRVLGFEVSALFRDPDGTVPHAQLVWRDGAINICSLPLDQEPTPVSTALTVEDRDGVDAAHSMAVEAGANVTAAPSEAFTGNYRFQVLDPEGNKWNVMIPWIDGPTAKALPARVI